MVEASGLSHMLKIYFRENPGAFLIVEFQVLLVTCAFFLINGDSTIADEVAVVAFYLLVIGVILQIVQFVRKEKDNENE